MICYLLRHGEAVPPQRWAKGDSVRPLSDQGKKAIQKLADHMKTSNLIPKAIFSSPFARAKETAEIVGRTLGLVPTMVKEMAAGARAEDFRKVVGPLSEDPSMSVLVVGHIPDLLDLACRLIHDPLIMEDGLAAGELLAIETTPITNGWGEGKVLWRKG